MNVFKTRWLIRDLLFFGGLVLAMTPSVLYAQANLSTSRAAQDDPSTWGMAFSTSYFETPIRPSSGDHVRGYELGLEVSYKISGYTLVISTGVSDEIGYEDNQSNFNNTLIRVLGLKHNIDDQNHIALPIMGSWGTNDDQVAYYGYRGSLGLAPRFDHRFQSGLLDGLHVGLSLLVTRAFYDFETNRGGVYNPKHSISMGPHLKYAALNKQIQLHASFMNVSTTLYDGSKTQDNYTANLGLEYQPPGGVAYALSWSQRDQTFGHNGVTPNVDFRFADLALVTLSVTYSSTFTR